MQQIYRRTPMPKCDFNKVAKQLYWNRTSAWVFSRKFAAYFQNTFYWEQFWTAAFDAKMFQFKACYLKSLSFTIWFWLYCQHERKIRQWQSIIIGVFTTIVDENQILCLICGYFSHWLFGSGLVLLLFLEYFSEDHSLNWFHAFDLFPYLLKTLENLWFSDVFRGYRKISVAWNGLIISLFFSL